MMIFFVVGNAAQKSSC